MSSDDIARDAKSQDERGDGDAYGTASVPANPNWANESTMALPITDAFPDDDE